jgi:HEPN domain-containing protein
MKKETRPAIRPNRIIWEHANSFKDAALICCENNLAQPMAVNAALAIELYLKSFLALNVIEKDSSNMGFTTEHGHVFTRLLDQLDPSDKRDLFDHLEKIESSTNWEKLFSRYDDTFIKIRYWYETGNGCSIGAEVVDLAVNLGEAVLQVGIKKHV